MVRRFEAYNILSMKRIIIPFLLSVISALGALGQNVGLKTNILSDAFYNPSLGVEVSVAPRWSIDISGQVNFWNLSHDRKWKHWLAQPEARYWFCQAFDGHFLGAHLVGGQYNLGGIHVPLHFLGTDLRKLQDDRYQGWMTGIGIGYGYSWTITKHFNIEAEIGIGYVFSKYDIFECAGCGRKKETGKTHNYVGPTKAAINAVYVF